MDKWMKRAVLGIALATLGSGGAEVVAQEREEDVAYKSAREAIARGQFDHAAELFARLRDLYPASQYGADSYYWQAFSRYRMEDLREALALLERQLTTYPLARINQDSRDLELRIRSMLGQRGDARSAERALREAERVLATSRMATSRLGLEAARVRAAAVGRAQEREGCEDDGVRQAAIQALMQMDTERAIPILRTVLERRGECSVPLRKQAIFVLSQHDPEEVEDLMVEVARTDPDPGVQEAAVFWLSSVGSESAVAALADILETTDDAALQENAIFALSQHVSARAGEILREYALDASRPERVREKAIFWLSQHPDHADASFLIELYSGLDSPGLKEHVFISISRLGDPRAVDWVFERALDRNEDMELRKQALFWAGQHSTIEFSRLVGLYGRLSDAGMKEQLIFLYAQREEDERVDRLIEIASSEEDPDLRKTAIFWLGQTGDERAIEYLLSLLDDPR